MLNKREKHVPPARVFAVTSGGGGAGKTNMVANLAAALTLAGKRVTAVDGHLGLAQLGRLLGVRPQYTLADFFAGQRSLAEVFVTSPLGITVLPAASGAQQVTKLSPEQKLLLLAELDAAPHDAHVVLVDTAGGLSDTGAYFVSAAHEIVCLITPEPGSLADAYALVKVLVKEHGEKRFWVVANIVENEAEARRLFDAFLQMIPPEVPASCELLGWVPRDSALTQAMTTQRTVVESAPKSPSARAFMVLADRLLEVMTAAIRVKEGLQFFFRGVLVASLEEQR